VLELFPGGLASLPDRTDEEIQAVVNDFTGPSAGANYKRARLCLYGTTALVALVDPAHENLWVANLGDCEAGTPPFFFFFSWAPLGTREQVG
jgi:pyruvate dehydrogenase phosphatase